MTPLCFQGEEILAQKKVRESPVLYDKRAKAF